MVHALKRKEIRLLMAGVAVLALTGCADSSRLDDPFSDPFKASASRYDRSPTGSTGAPAAGGENKDFFSETFRTFDESSSGGDSSADLRHPSSRPRPVAPLPIQSRATPPAPIVSQPLPAPGASASPAFSPAPAPVQAEAPAPRAVAARVGGWSIEGGVPVVVAQGETAGMIAKRYGVPAETLLQLNGYRTAAQVQPGARLTIPVYSAHGGRAEAPRAAAPAVAQIQPAQVQPAQIRPQESAAPAPRKPEPRFAMQTGPKSLVEEENENAKPVAAPPKVDSAAERKAQLAEARAAAIREAAAAIEKKKAQEAQASNAAAAEANKAAAAQAKLAAAQAKQAADAAKAEKLAQKAQSKAQQQAQAQPAPEEAKPAPEKQVASAPGEDATARTTPAGDSANPEFRWPARGRVIGGYGSGGNDGINIAVPEGTAVKAAEAGVVTYAGSELKGYGNLVLIHHPNGFDSVYANNGSLNVKRGDTVKRGQTIAMSGQSGNVSSPQLHFELRKGHKPVDPTGFLAGL
jgi:murein DD-endopeptidase MepM/ murein hydrolase activator NlpD